MNSENWGAVTIHGDKTQQERDWALREFKSGNAPILVATDVAARGLDVKDLNNVISEFFEIYRYFLVGVYTPSDR